MTEKIEITHESQARTDSKLSNLINWFNPFSRGVGMWAWLLQRITGLLLILYLINHFAVIGTMMLDSTGELYNALTISFGQPLIPALGFISSFEFLVDAGLIAVMIYHGYNGIRVVVFDLAPDTVRIRKPLFLILMILGVLTWIIAMWLILIAPAIVLEGA